MFIYRKRRRGGSRWINLMVFGESERLRTLFFCLLVGVTREKNEQRVKWIEYYYLSYFKNYPNLKTVGGFSILSTDVST